MKRAEGATQLEYFQLFDRCFFSVRVAMALQLRLRRAPAEGRSAIEPERERERAEPLDCEEPLDREDGDREPSDRDLVEADRDRERDREVASLPVFLRTLNDVALGASALPGPPPAELPTLRELLARVTAEPLPSARPRPAAGALRARLAGSATLPALTLPPRRTPPRPASLGLALRRATGPPPR